jgi:hypothetical protein
VVAAIPAAFPALLTQRIYRLKPVLRGLKPLIPAVIVGTTEVVP